MEVCKICGFKAKNQNGLRLHTKKHRNVNSLARIELFDKTNQLVASYPVIGEEEIKKAEEHAKKRGYKIKVEIKG